MTKLKTLLIALIAAVTLGACAGMNMNTSPVPDNSAFPAGTYGSPD